MVACYTTMVLLNQMLACFELVFFFKPLKVKYVVLR